MRRNILRMTVAGDGGLAFNLAPGRGHLIFAIFYYTSYNMPCACLPQLCHNNEYIKRRTVRANVLHLE